MTADVYAYEAGYVLKLFHRFSREGRIGHWARRMAELHRQLHACAGAAEIPNQRERLARKIRRAAALPGSLQSSLLEALAAMPDGDRICHGDFHPGNILVTAGGEVVIDWIDANCGNPVADVARTSVLLLGAAAIHPNPFMKGFIRLFHRLYLRHYFRLCPGAEPEYRRWLPIEAAARLAESIPQLEGVLLALARQR